MLKKISLSALSLISIYSFAQTNPTPIDVEACYGDEYFYSENGLTKYDPELHPEIDNTTQFIYRGEELIPHFFYAGSRGTNILVRNISESPLRFFFEPTFYSEASGSVVPLTNDVYFGIFSAANSPRNTAGALMQAKSYGRIQGGWTTVIHSGEAKIYWESESCLESAPMMTTVESEERSTSFQWGGISVQLINNGKPW